MVPLKMTGDTWSFGFGGSGFGLRLRLESEVSRSSRLSGLESWFQGYRPLSSTLNPLWAGVITSP